MRTIATLLLTVSIGAFYGTGLAYGAEPWEKLGQQAREMAVQGKIADAVTMVNEELRLAGKLVGRTHSHIAGLHQVLAELSEQQGNLQAAWTHWREVTNIRLRLYEPGDLRIAEGFHALGRLYRLNGQTVEAEGMLRKALGWREASVGLNHPATGVSLRELAATLFLTERHAESLEYYQRVLAITEQLVGRNHPAVAKDLNNIAVLYQRLDRFTEAQALMERALVILESASDSQDVAIAETVGNLAQLHHKEGRFAIAEGLYRRAIDGWKTVSGKGHPQTVEMMEAYALCLREEGKIFQAMRVEVDVRHSRAVYTRKAQET